jgi:transposase
MARVPTIAEEDAKRPNRERECLVGERTRIVNRIKSTLARLGIRDFKPTLRKAAERLATVHTPEGMPLPPNALAELQRDMARLGFVVSQIREIEDARQKRLEQQPETEPHAMVRLRPESSVLVSRRLICWSMRCCHGQCVTAGGRWIRTPGSS